MIAKSGPALYRLNLIRELREREKKVEKQNRLAVILGVGCFGFFLLSLLYSGLTIWQMEHVLTHEREKVARLHQEYQKYTASRLIVDKADVELLNDLKDKGILWTKKLASMAKHLPDNYLITRFSYNNNEMHVSGYGYASPQQDQLQILDQFLNRLRADTTFANTFPVLQLNKADRAEEAGRISFEFSAYTAKWKAQ
jgi:hypothetical protein